MFSEEVLEEAELSDVFAALFVPPEESGASTSKA
jgi:hypothetical protein